MSNKQFLAYGVGYSTDTNDLAIAEETVKHNQEGAIYRMVKEVCPDCHGSGVGLRLPMDETWPCRGCLGTGFRWGGPRHADAVQVSLPRWVFDTLIVGAQLEHARRVEENPRDRDNDRFREAWLMAHRAVNLLGEEP